MTPRLVALLLCVNGVLLAANLGAFGPEAPFGWFEHEREPERMHRQIRTEDLRILKPARAAQEAGQAPIAAQVPVSETGRMDDARRVAPRVAEAAVQTSVCMELGALTEAQAARGADQLSRLAGARIERVARQGDRLWWVRMPIFDTREQAARTVAELKLRNVGDSAIFQEGSGFVVSLGLFRDRSHAQRRLHALRAHDVDDAVLTQAYRGPSQVWLRITARADVAPRLATRLTTLKARLGAETLRACPAATAR